MRYALKEWNTTVEALGKGQIIAIWRKGGIEDISKAPNETFQTEQNQFILFPTFTHQSVEKIKKELWFLFDQSSITNKDNQVKIKYWAGVEQEIIPKSLDELLSISSELVNTREHLISSWNLYPNHEGKILLLRVYQLSNQILITNSPEYTGCKSWIELKIDIPKAGSKAVLFFKDFNKKVRLINAQIEQVRELARIQQEEESLVIH